MEVIIKETKQHESLAIVDPKTGCNYITDLIGNAGAMNDGQFTWDENLDAYVCSQEDFNWWVAVVDDYQLLDERIHELTQEHGAEAVYEVIHSAGNVDLEHHPANVHQALDAAFGTVEIETE